MPKNCLLYSIFSFLWGIDQVIEVIILWKSIQKYSVMPNAIGSHICHNRTWQIEYVEWRNIISKSWPVSLFLMESYLDTWNVAHEYEPHLWCFNSDFSAYWSTLEMFLCWAQNKITAYGFCTTWVSKSWQIF